MSQTYSNKDPEEIVPLGWDFAPLLSPGETILTAVWTVTDPENPGEDTSGMFPDGPAISGSIVKQRFQAGIDGNSYKHRIKITTSMDNTFVEKPTQLITYE